MKIRPRFSLSNASLLVLLSSAMAACGGSTSDSTGPHDAGSKDTGEDVADAPADAPSEAMADASDASDALDAADAAADACPPGSVPTGDGGCLPSVRRPFLVGSSMRTAGARRRDDWRLAEAMAPVSLDAATAATLAAIWLQDGLEEHASVAAFARFSLMLLSVGAPPDLVVASQRASLDEVHHARACFALAARYGAVEKGPDSLSLDGALSELSLAELAALTAEEGLVGETLGAILAIEELAVARDPEVVSVRDKLARDEVRHAELAWRFVRWAVLQDPEHVVPAVTRALERAITSALNMKLVRYEVDLDAWHAHGRLSCEEARALSERAVREVIRPCARELLAVPARRAMLAHALA